MSLGQEMQINATPVVVKGVEVYANIAAADQITEGMYLCYDTSAGTNKNWYCVKGTLANIGDFAGIVAPGQIRTGPGPVEIIPWDGRMYRGISAYVTENIAAGDLLGPIPGTYEFGRCVIGRPVFKATAALDPGATTPNLNLVTGFFGGQIATMEEQANKILRFSDHFIGLTTIAAAVANAVADQTTYLLTGTSSAAAYVDSLAGPEGTAAAAAASGILKVTTNTTNQANLTMNGEPFRLDANKNLFFRIRAAVDVVSASKKMAFGLGITDTTFNAGHSDALYFLVNAGAVTFGYQKGGAGEVTVTPSPAITVAAGDFHEFAFLARNKGGTNAGKEIQVWVDNTAVSLTLTSTEFPDDQSLTFIAEALGDSAVNMSLDRVEIVNYIG